MWKEWDCERLLEEDHTTSVGVKMKLLVGKAV